VIAAIEKATSLASFAKSQGAPLFTFALILSDSEGMELLDWFVSQQYEPNELLDMDVALAKKNLDPWPVLQEFTLMGFSIARASLVLN
jgi:hypothetical protein